MARIKARTSKDNRKDSKKVTPHSGKDDLKAQIQALGGDAEEDYELLKDADSDGLEGGERAAKDPKLGKDIAKFMKSLDFGNGIAVEDDAPPPKTSAKKRYKDTPKDAPKDEAKPKERPSNKPDARVAEIAGKVAETTRGGKTKFIVPPTSQWYLAIPPLTSPSSLPTPSSEYLASKSSLAESLLLQDVTAYTESSSHTTSSADARFLTRVLASGTLSDRLSALTLMAQGSPVHNARALESLKAMAAKKGREESLKALRAVVDWWVGGGVPDRKLKYFRDQPLTHSDVTDQHLMLWHFEDWLKKYFFAILQLLETLSVDPLPYVRTQAMNLIFQLLRDKPEQEQNLLRLLVNKLGDSEKSVASKASHALLQLLQTHPQMKSIIVHEVSALILRPPAPSTSASASTPKQKQAAQQQPSEGNTHARYYAVITFNQIMLLPQDKIVAARLVDVYFELFRALLGEDPVQADVPEGEGEARDFTPKQRRGYKGAATGKSKGKGKDWKGKGRAVDAFQEVPDSNSKVVSAILTGINRALPYAKTENSATFDKHIDTLFRITHTATFNVSLQALTLIHHVARASTSTSISDRFYRALYASLVDARLATSSKQAMYLNLLFKAVKADKNHPRVAAFVKRIVQVLGIHRPEFICGGLYLLGELFSVTPGVRDLTTVGREEAEPYDARKRDPQYAHAKSACLWELLPLLQHYHPSVALHARQLLTHAPVTATADLGLNTLSHFLDRFVYRNPKKPRAKGASAMQPAAADDGGGMVRAAGAGMVEVVNEEGFRKRREGDVPVDQVFFHKFFSRKHEKEQARAGKADKRKKHRSEGSDEDDLDDGAEGSESDAEEAEVWKAMKQSVPELGGSDVDDEDNLGISPDEDDEEDDAEDEDADAAVQSHSSDGSELDFMEDEDDLVSDADGDEPAGLIEYPSDASDSEDDEEQAGPGEGEWQGFGSEPAPKKRGRDAGADVDEGKKKRRKLKGLPTFASYDDYAAMIENSKDEDV